MASKNFTGYLRDPLGEYAAFDKWTFTHITTTGETVAGCTSILNIGEDGFYNINIEYGQVNIRTRDTINKNTINQGTYVINSDTIVSTLPALLNAEVPVSDPVILQMEAILEDAETAAEAAEQSAEEAAISAAALNDIRYSKLDNPLTHLFKKNKLVDTLSGDLTWTRASNATYVDMYGGLLYSPSNYATNLLTYSEDFSNAAWLKGSTSISVNTAISPKGSSTDEVIIDEVSSPHTLRRVFSSGQYLSSDNATITYSVFVKPMYTLESNIISLYSTSRDGLYRAITLNIKENTFFMPGATAKGNLSDEGNGWFRLSLTFNVGTGVGTEEFGINVGNYLGNGEVGYQVWGFQVEESPIANGYVKTLSTSVSGYSTVGIDQSRQEKEGWLIEGGSTNNCLDSEFQEAGTVWKDSVAPTVTINSSTAPDGTVTAVKVESSTSGSGIFQVNAHTSTTSTASVWLKGDTGAESVSFGFSDDRVIVTLSTEWQRFEYTGDGTGGLNFTLYSSGGAHTFYAWGAQSEALPFASSYMPTTDSAATRAADLVSGDSSGNIPKTNKGLSVITKFNYIGSVGSFWVFNARKPDGTYIVYYRGGLGDATWNIGTTELAANNIATRVSDSGSIGFSVEADSNYITAYNSNGESKTTEMSPTGESQDDGVGTFTVGKWSGGNQFMYGHLSDFRIYDFALNEAEVAFLAGE